LDTKGEQLPSSVVTNTEEPHVNPVARKS